MDALWTTPVDGIWTAVDPLWTMSQDVQDLGSATVEGDVWIHRGRSVDFYCGRPMDVGELSFELRDVDTFWTFMDAL